MTPDCGFSTQLRSELEVDFFEGMKGKLYRTTWRIIKTPQYSDLVLLIGILKVYYFLRENFLFKIIF